MLWGEWENARQVIKALWEKARNLSMSMEKNNSGDFYTRVLGRTGGLDHGGLLGDEAVENEGDADQCNLGMESKQPEQCCCIAAPWCQDMKKKSSDKKGFIEKVFCEE